MLFSGATKCHTQEAQPNNLTVISQLILKIASQVLEQVEVGDSSRIVIESSETTHAANWLIDKELITALSQKGVTQYFIQAHRNNSGLENLNYDYIISYQPLTISIDYKQMIDNKSKQDNLCPISSQSYITALSINSASQEYSLDEE